jgi:hypothetical protein
MALERVPQLSQAGQRRLREVARLRHHRVERRHAVALGEHEAIAIGPVGTPGVVLHAVEVEHGQQVDHRERAAGMSRARVRQHPEDLHAAVGCRSPQLFVGHRSVSSMKPAIS